MGTGSGLVGELKALVGDAAVVRREADLEVVVVEDEHFNAHLAVAQRRRALRESARGMGVPAAA